MDAADYVTMDEDIPVADKNMDGYEVQLLTELTRTDNSNSINMAKNKVHGMMKLGKCFSGRLGM